MKKKGKTALGLARSRQTKSEINVQTPTGLQNAELLANLGYGETTLLVSIDFFLKNEHHMFRHQRRARLFDLVVQVIDRMYDRTIPLDIDDYYDGELVNEMDHANMTRMHHLLRDAGDLLQKRMLNPAVIQEQNQVKEMDDSYDEDCEADEQLWTTD